MVNEVSIREATAQDAPFVAWVQVEAGRSGLPLGFWDLALPGADGPRLDLIAQVVTSPRTSMSHYDGFLIAEQDGEPVAAMTGYDPTKKKLGHFIAALMGVLVTNRWSEAHRQLVLARLAPVAACMSDTPNDRWVVEYVAAKPDARGKGVAARLLDAVLERGRTLGHNSAQISFLIGNTPAQRCYERAGFRVVDEKRHPEFEAIFGRPGTARMWRDL